MLANLSWIIIFTPHFIGGWVLGIVSIFRSLEHAANNCQNRHNVSQSHSILMIFSRSNYLWGTLVIVPGMCPAVTMGACIFATSWISESSRSWWYWNNNSSWKFIILIVTRFSIIVEYFVMIVDNDSCLHFVTFAFWITLWFFFMGFDY